MHGHCAAARTAAASSTGPSEAPGGHRRRRRLRRRRMRALRGARGARADDGVITTHQCPLPAAPRALLHAPRARDRVTRPVLPCPTVPCCRSPKRQCRLFSMHPGLAQSTRNRGPDQARRGRAAHTTRKQRAPGEDASESAVLERGRYAPGARPAAAALVHTQYKQYIVMQSCKHIHVHTYTCMYVHVLYVFECIVWILCVVCIAGLPWKQP
jgi:hypothetical protein